MDAALKKTKLDWNPIKIEEIAQHCNDRKLAAKAVSGICKHFFFVKSQCPISIIRHLTIFFLSEFLLFRAPIRLPENVVVDVVIVQKKDGKCVKLFYK